MKDEEMKDTMENILANEPELVPSSGFLASVMERVQEEAAAPPPIPFPWKRAVPGMILAVGVIGWGGVEFASHAIQSGAALTLHTPDLSAAVTQHLQQAGWVAVACAASLASWFLARRLTGRAGLL
jgi:ABC-type sugar transport system substrate-binding protein